jgi:hypothetical protein
VGPLKKEVSMNRTAATVLALTAILFTATESWAQSASVIVDNPPEEPANVITPPDTMPFTAFKNFSVPPDLQFTAVPVPAVTPPAGYRLIIDHVNIAGDTPAGQRVWFTAYVHNFWFSVPVAHQGTMTQNGLAYREILSGNAAMQVPVDPGQTFTLHVARSKPGGGEVFASVLVQGHFVRIAAVRPASPIP